MTSRLPLLALVALGLALAPSARSLTPAERSLLEKSIRPGELATVEAATGGLDALPLLTVDVTIDLSRRAFEGEARLDWKNTTGAARERIPVRLASNHGRGDDATVRWTNVKGAVGDAAPVLLEAEPTSDSVTWYRLPAPLPPGARVVLTGELAGRLEQLADGATDPMQAGMGLVMGGGQAPAAGDEYGTFACGDGICTLTGFAPGVAAFLDGAFDTDAGTTIGDPTYSEPMNVLLSVVAPSSALVAATGREVGSLPAGHGQRRTSFALAAAREAGLVVSRAFAETTRTVDGVRIRSLYRATDRRAGRRALDAAVGALQTFDRAFGRYPWSNLDVAEAGLVGGAGGVELPALALDGSGFYRRPTGMLRMADPEGRFFDETLAFITRHEVAHEWWYAQVGSHPQRHPYLDEPLAQWSAILATRAAEGERMARQDRDTQVAMNFQALGLMGAHDGVVARPAGSFSSMVEYAGLVYGKAPLFYEAVEKAIGRKALANALKGVVTRWRFRRMQPADLELALVQAGGEKIASLWKRWFYETHGDEDIGPLNLGGLAGMLGGAGLLGGAGGLGAGQPGASPFGGQLSPGQMSDAMKQLHELMRQLDPGDDAAPGPDDGDDPDSP